MGFIHRHLVKMMRLKVNSTRRSRWSNGRTHIIRVKTRKPIRHRVRLVFGRGGRSSHTHPISTMEFVNIISVQHQPAAIHNEPGNTS